MATIRRRGSGWQALIRKKQYLGPRSKIFTPKQLQNCGQMLLKGLSKGQQN